MIHVDNGQAGWPLPQTVKKRMQLFCFSLLNVLSRNTGWCLRIVLFFLPSTLFDSMFPSQPKSQGNVVSSKYRRNHFDQRHHYTTAWR